MKVKSSATAHRKKRRRHHKGAAFYAMPVIVLMSVALAVLVYKQVRVQTITVEGTSRYQSGEIIAASGLEIGASMFRVKPSEVSASIQRSLYYIGDAQLRFELPTQIVLSVQEAQVICSVKNGEGYVLISDSYKVLQENAPTPDANAPLITGIVPLDPLAGEPFSGTSEEDLTILQSVLQSLEQHPILQITTIDLGDISNIQLGCKDDNSILLGGPGELSYKFEFIDKIVQQYQDAGTFLGVIINAQALDGEASPSISVLSGKSEQNQIPEQNFTQEPDETVDDVQ
ncbi:MAG: cell division protein FtsQ/DivIB [Acetanaerobacterium sp.]